MRIGILTQYYPPELGAPQQRLSELAGHFVKAGHDVHVLTAMPSYPKGRVFDGYGGVFSREDRDGVDVRRTFIYPTQSAALPKRLANYFSFVLSSGAIGTLALPRLDFLLVESPPLFLGAAGMFLSAAKRARLIFNVSDLWPESAVRLGVVRKGSASERLASALERVCYERAWLVTGQSRTILDDISARFPDVRTHHLSNGCDTTKYGPERATAAARAQLDPEGDKRVFVYAGLHGLAQGLDQIVDAADRLRSDPRIRFVLIGDGPEKRALIEDVRRRGLDNIRFLDAVPAVEVPPLLASADGIIVTLKMDIPGAVPSKIYEAMASERPVILVAVGEAARIVDDAGGFTLAPGDIDALVRAVRSVVDDPAGAASLARGAREKTRASYDRRAIADRFIALLASSSRVQPNTIFDSRRGAHIGGTGVAATSTSVASPASPSAESSQTSQAPSPSSGRMPSR